MSVTSYEIAKACGVSQATVSRILSGRGGHRHAERTRRRVLALSTKLGYRVNAAARSTSTGRFNALALVLSRNTVWSMLSDRLLAGIQDALDQRDLHLVLSRLPDEKLTSDGFVPKILRQTMADGLLINYNARIPARMIELINAHHIPAIWINSKQAHNCIYPDDEEAGREATRRLLQLGHRRIAYVDPSRHTDEMPAHYSFLDRRAGYLRAMAEAGLTPRCFGQEEYFPPDRSLVDNMLALLRLPERPSALLCYSVSALRAATIAARLLNLEVPRDLSLLTFAGAPQSGEFGPVPSFMVIPEYALGEQAVELLLQKIDNPVRRFPAQALAFGFYQGQTLGPCSAITQEEVVTN